jgi:hypothetical protein
MVSMFVYSPAEIRCEIIADIQALSQEALMSWITVEASLQELQSGHCAQR